MLFLFCKKTMFNFVWVGEVNNKRDGDKPPMTRCTAFIGNAKMFAFIIAQIEHWSMHFLSHMLTDGGCDQVWMVSVHEAEVIGR